jgi:hypothetical protein
MCLMLALVGGGHVSEASAQSEAGPGGGVDGTWAMSQIYRNYQVPCVTFLATARDNSLLAATFNNSNTTDAVALWHFPRNNQGLGLPVAIFREEVAGYKGYGGLATFPDGSVVASIEYGLEQGSALIKLKPDFSLDPSFGTGGKLLLPGLRAMGVAVHGSHLYLGVAWGRVQIRDGKDGSLLAESVRPGLIPSGTGTDHSSTTTAQAEDARPTTAGLALPAEPVVPPWMVSRTLPQAEAISRRVEAEPRIRDLAVDPASGVVYGVGSDRVYRWVPSRPGTLHLVGPTLVIDGKGPVLPAQGISIDPQRRMLRYAANQAGTLAQAAPLSAGEQDWSLSLFSVFQASSSSSRAVDSTLSMDGQTMWVSDLSGTITEYQMRPGVGPTGQFEPQPGMLPGNVLDPKLAEGTVEGDPTTLKRAVDLLRSPVMDGKADRNILILFVSRQSPEAQEAARLLAGMKDRLNPRLEVGLCDVAEDRHLLIRYGVYLAPTLLVVDGHGQEKARHEGRLGQVALAELLRRAAKRTDGPVR